MVSEHAHGTTLHALPHPPNHTWAVGASVREITKENEEMVRMIIVEVGQQGVQGFELAVDVTNDGNGTVGQLLNMRHAFPYADFDFHEVTVVHGARVVALRGPPPGLRRRGAAVSRLPQGEGVGRARL